MKYLLMGLIRLYQIVLSPMVNWRGPVCRYEPSCSHYGYEAVKTHGAIKGGGMTVWRVLRCNPWSAGGYDPVKPRQTRGEKKDRRARNLSGSETSSPGGDTPTSDRTEKVGMTTKPARDAVRPDLMSSRGARS
jgi:putative membrane protein insertion efficiency factor